VAFRPSLAFGRHRIGSDSDGIFRIALGRVDPGDCHRFGDRRRHGQHWRSLSCNGSFQLVGFVTSVDVRSVVRNCSIVMVDRCAESVRGGRSLRRVIVECSLYALEQLGRTATVAIDKHVDSLKWSEWLRILEYAAALSFNSGSHARIASLVLDVVSFVVSDNEIDVEIHERVQPDGVHCSAVLRELFNGLLSICIVEACGGIRTKNWCDVGEGKHTSLMVGR